MRDAINNHFKTKEVKEESKQLSVVKESERVEPKKTNKEVRKELYQPKDKWKVGKTLLELQKKFPFDEIVKRMVKEEFRSNKLFRYPEEYEVYDEDEEAKRKTTNIGNRHKKKGKNWNEGGAGFKVVMTQAEKEAAAKKQRENRIETLKNAELPELNAIRNKKVQKANDMKLLIQHIQTLVKEYKNLRETQSEEGKGVLPRTYIEEQYNSMLEKFPNEMARCFPKLEQPKSNVKHGKSYPREFKTCFLDVLRGHAAVQKGRVVKKDKVPYWIPSSKFSRLPEKMLSLAQLTAKSANAKGRHAPRESDADDLGQFQLHPWNRKDDLMKEKLLRVMLTYSDAENCTFRPKISKYTIEGRPPRPVDEVDPKELVEELGENFQKKYPYVFKSGVYSKAASLFHDGKYVEAMRKLKSGFNVDSLLRNFHPNYEEYKKY